MKNSNIKKKIGETAYQFLIRNFSDDFLSEHLPQIFGVLQEVRLIENLDPVKTLLNDRLNLPIEKRITKTPKELLDEAGFILVDTIETEADYAKFSKYYRNGEKLCKFGSYDATTRYSRLFWIFRKGFEIIEPSDNPKRQDEYSTSSMSVAISKDKKNVSQICSRYNHRVSGCDNVYNSNLDNIVSGLTEATNQEYNLSLGIGQTIEINNFYFANDKYWFCDREINGIKYGKNTMDGVYYDPSQYLIFDHFILDIKNKKIKTGCGTNDAFCDIVNDNLAKGYKIQIMSGETPNDIDHENKILIYVN